LNSSGIYDLAKVEPEVIALPGGGEGDDLLEIIEQNRKQLMAMTLRNVSG